MQLQALMTHGQSEVTAINRRVTELEGQLQQEQQKNGMFAKTMQGLYYTIPLYSSLHYSALPCTTLLYHPTLLHPTLQYSALPYDPLTLVHVL